MKKSDLHSDLNTTAASHCAMPFACQRRGQRGSVLFYIFIAIGLLAALTLTFVNSGKEGITTQAAQRMTENLYVQANGIKSSILECVYTYPNGGGDLDGDGDIDSDDNSNIPYPLDPTDANNPDGAAANDQVRNMQCPGAPSGSYAIYDGVGTTGKFLPPQVNGFSEWIYQNNANGIYIQTTGAADQAVTAALDRLEARFDTCEADLDYGSCGATCLTIFILRATCP
jgi:hypothetical protein